jgi:hypothetical protein
MHNRTLRPEFILPLIAAVIVWVLPWGAMAASAPAASTATPPTAPSAAAMPTQKEWILVDLPPDATQLQYGAEVWRLVCSACHAYDGTGLTDKWRATWPAEDQNCWQAKCHGPGHPPDGFQLPIAPGVVGDAVLAGFPTANDLHRYIQAAMPWQNPNSLTSKDSWSVTAYVIKLNRMNPGENLGPENASALRLAPVAPSPTPSPIPATPTSASTTSESSLPNAVAPLVMLALVLVVWMLRRRQNAPDAE